MFVGQTSISGTLILLKRHVYVLRQFRKRLHTHKLIVTQADKGKTVVTINVHTCQRKIGSFLTEIVFLRYQNNLPACIKNNYSKFSINVMLLKDMLKKCGE
jgi:transketolase C-terminal domain/subunit